MLRAPTKIHKNIVWLICVSCPERETRVVNGRHRRTHHQEGGRRSRGRRRRRGNHNHRSGNPQIFGSNGGRSLASTAAAGGIRHAADTAGDADLDPAAGWSS